MKASIREGIRHVIITVSIIAIAMAGCFAVKRFSATELPIALIFVIAVLVVSRLTDGFAYGVITSVLAVFIINFAFTYPYSAFNFTIEGYPLTFITLFVASLITSTLTTQIKKQQSIRAFAEREKLYADFLRTISHDLRTPLTTIVGSTSAIIDDGDRLSEGQKRLLLSEIRNEASWLVRMVENILSITRVRGEAKICKTPEALEELVGEVAGIFRKRYPGVDLRVCIPEELVFVKMDGMLIEQVLMNLMENAVLHGKGMTQIAFSVRIEGMSAIFSISNDGEEADVAAVKKIIEGDFIAQDIPEALGSRQGHGIGLSVCTSIIKAHGGEMFSHANPGGGLCLGFGLPLGEGS